MPTPRPSIVTRHDPVEKIDANLWAVNGGAVRRAAERA